MSTLLSGLQNFYVTLELLVIKDQFQTTTWLLIGAGIQLLLLTCLSLRTAAALVLAVGAWRLGRTLAISRNFLPNDEMKDVFPGKSTAMFPNEDGSGRLNPSGRGLCLLLLGFKVNQYVISTQR